MKQMIWYTYEGFFFSDKTENFGFWARNWYRGKYDEIECNNRLTVSVQGYKINVLLL